MKWAVGRNFEQRLGRHFGLLGSDGIIELSNSFYGLHAGAYGGIFWDMFRATVA